MHQALLAQDMRSLQHTIPGFFAALMVVAGPIAQAEQISLEQFVEIRDQIQLAFYEGNPEVLDVLRRGLEASTADGSAEDLRGYYLAYSSFRLGQLTSDDKKRAKAYLNGCIDALKDVIERSPEMVEGLAEAYLYLGKLAKLAAEAEVARNALEKAIEIAPNYREAIDEIGKLPRPGPTSDQETP